MNENFFAAKAQLCEDLFPVTTIRPDAKSKAVAFGSRRRIITAAKRRGLNSVLRQRRAICLRSSLTPRLAILFEYRRCNAIQKRQHGERVKHMIFICIYDNLNK